MLRCLEGFVTLPAAPAAGATRPAHARPRRATAASARSAAPESYLICFPEGYFTFDEPPPPGQRVAPWGWNTRSTHHGSWNVASDPALSCRFGGRASGRCAVCGEGLHHLITLPSLPGAAFEGLGAEGAEIATCLSCLGWSEPALFFEHTSPGETRATGYSGGRRSPEQRAAGLRPTTVHLGVAPAPWRRLKWEDADAANLNRVGGRPSWVQSPEPIRCCRCRKRMGFLLQLDSELPDEGGQRWRWGSGGLLYVFWCGACRIDGQLWQCS